MVQEDITLVRPGGLERHIYDNECVEKTGDEVCWIVFKIFLRAILSTQFTVFILILFILLVLTGCFLCRV